MKRSADAVTGPRRDVAARETVATQRPEQTPSPQNQFPSPRPNSPLCIICGAAALRSPGRGGDRPSSRGAAPSTRPSVRPRTRPPSVTLDFTHTPPPPPPARNFPGLARAQGRILFGSRGKSAQCCQLGALRPPEQSPGLPRLSPRRRLPFGRLPPWHGATSRSVPRCPRGSCPLRG